MWDNKPTFVEWGSVTMTDDSDRYKRSRTERNTATTVPCCRGCCSDEWICRASCVLLLKDTTGEALQLPLSHICFTHTLCLHYQIAVWVFWREFCSCWPYQYDCLTNGHGDLRGSWYVGGLIHWGLW